ncbi:MAG TPA: hypothetical protein VHO70_17575 [Chitinispirillaceae bacterium]|nr:hypothetical protein [Chitinispirillaceae bacterium]
MHPCSTLRPQNNVTGHLCNTLRSQNGIPGHPCNTFLSQNDVPLHPYSTLQPQNDAAVPSYTVLQPQNGACKRTCSTLQEFSLWQDQLRSRETQIETKLKGESPLSIAQDIADHMRWLLSVLNEKQSRLYLEFESIRVGHGGDVAIARITGVNVKTIAQGRHELQQRQNDPDRIRTIGAGRPEIKKS